MKFLFSLILAVTFNNIILSQIDDEQEIKNFQYVIKTNIIALEKYKIVNNDNYLVSRYQYNPDIRKAEFNEYSNSYSEKYSNKNLVEIIGSRKTVFKYKNKNQISDELVYSLGSESPDFITKYVYSGGRLIEKRTGADKITYKYGPNGSWMEIRSTDPNNGEKEITKYEYDKSKNLLSRVFDVPNRPAYYKEDVYKYDESNKLVWKYFDRNTYYYEYDERGNLIKTVKYEGLFEDLTLPNTDKSPKTTLYYYDNENYLIGLENKDGMYVFIYEKNAD